MTQDIPGKETLTVEFKSDLDRLPDRELVAAAVCLANTEGGEIYLGVEDTGVVTGLHPAHKDMPGLTALIANRTHPSLGVRAALRSAEGKLVARIEVPKARGIVATSDGLVQHRRLQADGTPECVPMYPYDYDRRYSDLGLLDYSARLVADASIGDFDPLERERLRRAFEQ